ncbi:MAG: MBL fold metallo-hydrolase, partial [Dehalococcoidales bacterium]
TIELVVLTHPQADHLTGLVEVLKRYKVEQVLYPDLDYDSLIYQEWLKLLEEKNIKSTIAQAGQQIVLGELALLVLNPPNPPLTGTDADTNNNSLVLHISMGEISFLLTADIMWEAEFELLSRRAITAITVLKIAHHGSATSTTAEFLAVASPQLAVISVGEDNDFGHPNQEVIARLEELLGAENIYITYHGTIEFITDGERLWVRVEG